MAYERKRSDSSPAPRKFTRIKQVISSYLEPKPSNTEKKDQKATDAPQEVSKQFEIDEEKFNQSPQKVLDSVMEGKQVVVKNSEDKTRITFSSTSRNLFPEVDLSSVLEEDKTE